MRGLEFQAKPHSIFKNFNYCLFSDTLYELFIFGWSVRTAVLLLNWRCLLCARQVASRWIIDVFFSWIDIGSALWSGIAYMYINELLDYFMLIFAHLFERIIWIKLVRRLHEARLLDGSIKVTIFDWTTFKAAHWSFACLRVFHELGETRSTFNPLLRHFSVFCFALFDDVHSYLHSQFFLLFIK